MDIRAFLTFVANHVEQIFGVTLVLFLVTSLLLLIRSIRTEKAGETGAGAALDVSAVEEAVRRVVGSTPLTVTSPAAGTPGAEGSADSGALERALQDLSDRDSKIEQLSKEIETLRAQVASATGGGPGISEAELNALKAKLDQMQARLAEYEIIEDDIADLSMFKEENARLKAEIEELRAKLAGLPSASAPMTESAAPTVSSEVPPSPKQDESRVNDDLMREFAAAVDAQRAPPADISSSVALDVSTPLPPVAAAEASSAADDILTGTPDPDKMLSEVEALSQVKPSDDSAPPTHALEETLDTDKLLAEVGNLELNLNSNPNGDDLLSEFSAEPSASAPGPENKG